jgi:hypothetical protein
MHGSEHIALLQELAWASFALLRNTAASGMMFIRQGRVLLARGSLGPVADGNSSEEALKTLSSVRLWTVV